MRLFVLSVNSPDACRGDTPILLQCSGIGVGNGDEDEHWPSSFGSLVAHMNQQASSAPITNVESKTAATWIFDWANQLGFVWFGVGVTLSLVAARGDRVAVIAVSCRQQRQPHPGGTREPHVRVATEVSTLLKNMLWTYLSCDAVKSQRRSQPQRSGWCAQWIQFHEVPLTQWIGQVIRDVQRRGVDSSGKTTATGVDKSCIVASSFIVNNRLDSGAGVKITVPATAAGVPLSASVITSADPLVLWCRSDAVRGDVLSLVSATQRAALVPSRNKKHFDPRSGELAAHRNPSATLRRDDDAWKSIGARLDSILSMGASFLPAKTSVVPPSSAVNQHTTPIVTEEGEDDVESSFELATEMEGSQAKANDEASRVVPGQTLRFATRFSDAHHDGPSRYGNDAVDDDSVVVDGNSTTASTDTHEPPREKVDPAAHDVVALEEIAGDCRLKLTTEFALTTSTEWFFAGEAPKGSQDGLIIPTPDFSGFVMPPPRCEDAAAPPLKSQSTTQTAGPNTPPMVHKKKTDGCESVTESNSSVAFDADGPLLRSETAAGICLTPLEEKEEGTTCAQTPSAPPQRWPSLVVKQCERLSMRCSFDANGSNPKVQQVIQGDIALEMIVSDDELSASLRAEGADPGLPWRGFWGICRDAPSRNDVDDVVRFQAVAVTATIQWCCPVPTTNSGEESSAPSSPHRGGSGSGSAGGSEAMRPPQTSSSSSSSSSFELDDGDDSPSAPHHCHEAALPFPGSIDWVEGPNVVALTSEAPLASSRSRNYHSRRLQVFLVHYKSYSPPEQRTNSLDVARYSIRSDKTLLLALRKCHLAEKRRLKRLEKSLTTSVTVNDDGHKGIMMNSVLVPFDTLCDTLKDQWTPIKCTGRWARRRLGASSSTMISDEGAVSQRELLSSEESLFKGCLYVRDIAHLTPMRSTTTDESDSGWISVSAHIHPYATEDQRTSDGVETATTTTSASTAAPSLRIHAASQPPFDMITYKKHSGPVCGWRSLLALSTALPSSRGAEVDGSKTSKPMSSYHKRVRVSVRVAHPELTQRQSQESRREVHRTLQVAFEGTRCVSGVRVSCTHQMLNSNGANLGEHPRLPLQLKEHLTSGNDYSFVWTGNVDLTGSTTSSTSVS